MTDFQVRIGVESGQGPGLTNARGLYPASTVPIPALQLASTGNIAGNFRIKVPVGRDFSTLSATFANWYVRFNNPGFAEANGPATVTVTAAWEKVDGTIIPLCTSQAVTAGGTVTPPDVTVNYSAADGHVWLRVYVVLPNTGVSWPECDIGNATQRLYSSSPVDQTGTAGALSGGSTATHAYAPVAIVGRPVSWPSKLVVVQGDSVSTGYHDSNDAQGWPVRVFGGDPGVFTGRTTQAALRATLPSEGVFDVIQSGAYTKRLALMAGATHAVLAYGLNDMATGGGSGGAGSSFATLSANYDTFIATLQAAGMDVTAVTVNPSGVANSSVRTAFNNWIRAGSSDADAFQDLAAATETSQNSNTFKGGMDSGDSIHPNATGHAAIAAAFDLALVT